MERNMILTARTSLIGTKRERKFYFRPMNYKFTLHNYVRKKDGKVVLYLELSHDGKRVKEAIQDVYINPNRWLEKKQRLRAVSREDVRINEILDEIENKILSIKTKYSRDGNVLTLDKFIEEYKNYNSYIDFLDFMDREINGETKIMKPGSVKANRAVYNKLRGWKSQILFYEIDEDFFKDFLNYCKNDLKNVRNTINKNIVVIKKYLKKAKKKGIKLSIDLDDVKIKSVTADRVDLNIYEIRKLMEMFQYPRNLTYPEFHALGLFLISCFLGLRYQDLEDFNLNKIHNDIIILTMNKTEEPLRIPVTPGVKRIIYSLDWSRKISYQRSLDHLKSAAMKAGIKKRVSFHVGRHSFATNYVRTDGNVIKLQKLLGHKNIKTTMIYVHLSQNERDEHIFKLDEILSGNDFNDKKEVEQ
ncbi:hypothetical protein HMPREF2660_08770 [Weeksella sp. HMSC059D05]|nr:hypothetical protein HMPREF2660_08770 [Weeksella sp. HMSC059D05]